MKSFTSSRKLLTSYRDYRQISVKLVNHDLPDSLSKDAIKVCGKTLGILKGKNLILNTEDELSLFFDYCLFHYFTEGKNAIDRYADKHLDKLPKNAKRLVAAMQEAQFAILLIEETLSYGGVIVTDVLRGRKELLIDEGLSTSTVPGLVLGSSIFRFPEFIMTSGAGFPLNKIINLILPIIMKKITPFGSFDLMPRMNQSALIAKLLKVCFRKFALENMTYVDLNESTSTLYPQG